MHIKKFEVKIITNYSSFTQIVEAENPKDALEHIDFLIFEAFEEYVITIKEVKID